MLNICMIDDNKNFTNQFERYARVSLISRKEEFHITIYTNPIEFLKDHQGYDIVFLDIEMPKLTGIELGEKIRKKNNKTVICFVTRFTNYALDGYSCHAYDYLVKPLSQNIVDHFFDDFFNNYISIQASNISSQNLSFQTIDGIVTLPLNEIISFEYIAVSNIHFNRVVELNTISKGKFLIKMNISKIFKDLDKTYFMVPHKSFIINMKNIFQLKQNMIIMINQDEIPISQKRMSDVKQCYFHYLEQYKKGKVE